jgi:hypothetical protein
MKKAIMFIAAFLCFNIKAQDTIRRFELGSTLITVNSINYIGSQYAKPSLQFMNGLFFRYNFKRISLRATASYSEYDYIHEDPPYYADGGGIKSHNKDFHVGAGVQLSLLRKKDILYAFSDIVYRNLFSTGDIYGGIGGSYYNFAQTSNGFGGNLGLGCKIAFCKSIALSPEVCYSILTDYIEGSLSSYPYSQADKYKFFSPQNMVMARLHLTVKF